MLAFCVIKGLLLHRVRPILIMHYWVLGDIRRYWIVLLLGDIFFVPTTNTIPIGQQSAMSTLITIIVIIIQFWNFTWHSVVYTPCLRKKTCKLWNGIPQNCKDRFWRHLAEIFKIL